MSVMHGDWLIPCYLSKERRGTEAERIITSGGRCMCAVSAFMPVTIHGISRAALSAQCHTTIAGHNEVFSGIISKYFPRPVKHLGSVLWGTRKGAHSPGTWSSGVPKNFVRWGGSTNSVEDRGQRERGSGGGSPLVRGSGGSCNLV